MPFTSRRSFVRNAALGAGLAGAPAVYPSWGQNSPNNQINLGVVGFRGRGRDHYRAFAQIPGVRVAYLCDVDERLFPGAVAEVEKIGGNKPATFVDLRKLLQQKDLDAISIATPDHWHALQTIWACQAGKDVYVEKPACHNLREGRKMVEAARKYNRIVQVGLNRRSELRNKAGITFVREARFGPAYRAKSVVYRGRTSIGHVQESSIPSGVHWDLYLGPAPYRAFTLNRFHYGWHYFWDTATTELGNNGVHTIDVVRWALNKNVHPVKIHCNGSLFADDSDQQTPNVQNATFEYADGTLVDLEATTLPSPTFGGVHMGEFFYTPQGYVTSAQKWSTVIGEFTPGNTPDPPSGISLRASNLSFPKIAYKPGPPIPDIEGPEVSHFQNFIDCMRSRKREDLHCEVLEGHMSTALCHLANISFRTGRKLIFDPATETFPGDAEANKYLTREYREPYGIPDQV
ncbi:MAG: Gfo/Idh/MocA family oxidoreductase [Bryobacteraceae bacterium]|nr:Gfo/Idh/MocA family oxidoreductase [Bryobacterales bacterium]NUN01634.1 Gfo/Idh/MocA family oxidoreductase [Bryobacteraceae bacterium]